jgi:hypothetical protein
MAKIRMKKPAEAVTLRNAFREFTVAQAAKGVKDKTLQTYSSHFKAAERHLNEGYAVFSFLRRGNPFSPRQKGGNYGLPRRFRSQ